MEGTERSEILEEEAVWGGMLELLTGGSGLSAGSAQALSSQDPPVCESLPSTLA